jgi:hypothetical protein
MERGDTFCGAFRTPSLIAKSPDPFLWLPSLIAPDVLVTGKTAENVCFSDACRFLKSTSEPYRMRSVRQERDGRGFALIFQGNPS